MMRILSLATAWLLCGCATSTPVAPTVPIAEITYQAGACYGTCPIYSVTVSNRGTPGVFEGERHTAVAGRREFSLQPAAFNAFYLALAGTRAADQSAYEPGGANCKQQVTDNPSVIVTFREGDAPPRTFRYDFGCRDPQNATLAKDLKRAPTLLPIGDFIGRR